MVIVSFLWRKINNCSIDSSLWITTSVTASCVLLSSCYLFALLKDYLAETTLRLPGLLLLLVNLNRWSFIHIFFSLFWLFNFWTKNIHFCSFLYLFNPFLHFRLNRPMSILRLRTNRSRWRFNTTNLLI